MAEKQRGPPDDDDGVQVGERMWGSRVEGQRESGGKGQTRSVIGQNCCILDVESTSGSESLPLHLLHLVPPVAPEPEEKSM